MQEGIQRGALNADKGLNTRKFLLSVLAFLIVAFLAIGAWSLYAAHTGKPSVNTKGKAGDGNTALDKGGTGR